MSGSMLLAAAKRALSIIEADYDALLECNSRLDRATLAPIAGTLDPLAEIEAAEMRDVIAQLRSAIANATPAPVVVPIRGPRA